MNPNMAKKITTTRTIIMVAGLLQFALGALFWTGIAKGLVPVHMIIGLILVLALWTLTFFAARAGVGTGLVVLTAVWGLVVPAVGATQTSILPGSLHWVVQVAHLAIGLVAIGLARTISDRALPSSPDRTDSAGSAATAR